MSITKVFSFILRRGPHLTTAEPVAAGPVAVAAVVGLPRRQRLVAKSSSCHSTTAAACGGASMKRQSHCLDVVVAAAGVVVSPESVAAVAGSLPAVAADGPVGPVLMWRAAADGVGATEGGAVVQGTAGKRGGWD